MYDSEEHVDSPPCKKNKCILYPSCLTKEVIGCILLREYYDCMVFRYLHLANRNARTFATIHQVLPKLITIKARDACV